MNTAFGIMAFITRCSLPLWVRWHSSTKTKTSPTVWLGWASSSLMNCVEVIDVLAAELVDQGAEQSRLGLAELAHQVAAAVGAFDRLADLGEDPLDLLVEFIAVGDDDHAGVGVVFQNPLGQEHHHDALAATLRVPDDAALAVVYVLLRGLDAEILVYAGQLLDAAVEEHEVVHQFDQPVLARTF